MNWKSVIIIAAGATLGTVLVHSYFSGFNLVVTLAVGLAAFLGAAFSGYISTLGKPE